MASFLHDTFTDTAGTALTSHTGETGATWSTPVAGTTGDLAISDANRARLGAAGDKWVLASGTPASADYTIVTTFRSKSSPWGYVLFRAANDSLTAYGWTWTGGYSYVGYFNASIGPTFIGTTKFAMTADTDYTIRIVVAGTNIKVFIDDGNREYLVHDITDANISAAGFVGFGSNQTGSNSTGTHWDELEAADGAGYLTASPNDVTPINQQVEITVTGVNTSWTGGTSFTLTNDGANASIVSQSVANSTTAAVTVNTGDQVGRFFLNDGENLRGVPISATDVLVVIDGNSLSNSGEVDLEQTVSNPHDSQNKAWLWQLNDLLGNRARVRSWGTNQATMPVKAALDNAYDADKSANFAIGLEVVNACFGGTSEAAILSEFDNWNSHVSGVGYRVLNVTPPPNTDGTMPAGYETKRQSIATEFRNDVGVGIEAVVDVAADTTVGEEFDSDNTTYYKSDKTHWTDSGAAVVAGLASDALDIPPQLPSGFTATANGTDQIDLSWTDNSDDETGFFIEVSADGATGWITVTTTAANANSYSHTGRTAGTTYYYRISAVNAAGSSSVQSANATTATTQVSYVIVSGAATMLLTTGGM